jgi:hypothetical protein
MKVIGASNAGQVAAAGGVRGRIASKVRDNDDQIHKFSQIHGEDLDA